MHVKHVSKEESSVAPCQGSISFPFLPFPFIEDSVHHDVHIQSLDVYRLHQRPGTTLSEHRVYNTCPHALSFVRVRIHPLQMGVSAKHKQTGKNRIAETVVCASG